MEWSNQVTTHPGHQRRDTLDAMGAMAKRNATMRLAQRRGMKCETARPGNDVVSESRVDAMKNRK